MNQYVCPTCNKQVERDMMVFVDHTQEHIVEEIKKKHPEWVDSQGLCKPCLEYFRKAMKPKT